MKLTESLFSFPSILYDEIQMIKRETNEIEVAKILNYEYGK